MKRAIAANGIPQERIFPVPMGVRSDLLSTQNEARSEAVKSPSVLYLGSMVPLRKLDFIIQAFARVLEAVPDATLYMVGGERPEYIDSLRSEARRLGIDDRVAFTPLLPRAEASEPGSSGRRLLVAVDPTPSSKWHRRRSSSNTWHSPSPWSATTNRIRPESFERAGADCASRIEVEPFADAVITLLKNPELAREMGKKGREYVAKHRSYPRIADGVAEVCNRLVGAT